MCWRCRGYVLKRSLIYVFAATVLATLVGCSSSPQTFRFSYPREDQPATNAFIAKDSIPSPVPQIALYTVRADNGLLRPGIVCYVATDIRPVADTAGPKVWKRVLGRTVEYEAVAAAVIDADKFKTIQDGLGATTPGQAATIVPCDLVINAIEIPGTFEHTRALASSYYRLSGDLLWIIRISADLSLAERIETLMGSNTGFLLPTKATLKGLNLQIAPPFSLRASVLNPEN